MATNISVSYEVRATAGFTFRIRDHELEGLSPEQREERIEQMILAEGARHTEFKNSPWHKHQEYPDKILQYDK